MASDPRSPDGAGAPAPMKLGAACLARSIGRVAAPLGGVVAPIRRAGDLASTISSFGRNLGGSLRSRPIRPSFSTGVPEVRFPAGVWAMPAIEPEAPSDMDPAMAALHARLRQSKAPKKAAVAPPRRGLPSTLRRHGMSLSGPGTGPSGFARRLAPADTFVPRNDGHFSTTPGRPRQIGPGGGVNGAKPAALGPSTGWTSKPAPRPRFSARASTPAPRAARAPGATSPRSTSRTRSRSAEAPEGEPKVHRSHVSRRAGLIDESAEPRVKGGATVRSRREPSDRSSHSVSSFRPSAVVVRMAREGRTNPKRVVRPRQAPSKLTGSISERIGGLSGARRQARDKAVPLSARSAGSARSLRRSATGDTHSASRPVEGGVRPSRSDRATARVAGGPGPSADRWSDLRPLSLGVRRIGLSSFANAGSRMIGSLAPIGPMVASRLLPTAPHERAQAPSVAPSGWSARLHAAWSAPSKTAAGPLPSVRFPTFRGPTVDASKSVSIGSKAPLMRPAGPPETSARRANAPLVGWDRASMMFGGSPLGARERRNGPLRLDRIHRHAQPLAGSRSLRCLDRALGVGPTTAHTGAASAKSRTAKALQGQAPTGDGAVAAEVWAARLQAAFGGNAEQAALPLNQVGVGGSTQTASGTDTLARSIRPSAESPFLRFNQTARGLGPAPSQSTSAGVRSTVSLGQRWTSPRSDNRTSRASLLAIDDRVASGAGAFGSRLNTSSSPRPPLTGEMHRDLDGRHPLGSAWIGADEAAASSHPTLAPTRLRAPRTVASPATFSANAASVTNPGVGWASAAPGVNTGVGWGSAAPGINTGAGWASAAPGVGWAPLVAPGIARLFSSSTESLPPFATSTAWGAARPSPTSWSGPSDSAPGNSRAGTSPTNRGSDHVVRRSGPTTSARRSASSTEIHAIDDAGRSANSSETSSSSAQMPPKAVVLGAPAHVIRRRPVRERRAAALDVLRRSPAIQTRALPASYRSLAAYVTSGSISIAHDATAQAALSAAGVSAATVGRTILLERAPTMAARDRELVAHEMVHAAANTKIPRFFDDPHHDHEERTAVSVGRLARSLSAETIRTAPVPPILGGPTGKGTGTSMVAPPPFGAHTAVAPPKGPTGMGAAAIASAAAPDGPRPQIRRSTGGRSTTTLHRSAGSSSSSSSSSTHRAGGAAGQGLQRQAAPAASVVPAATGGGQQAAGSLPGAGPSGATAKGRSLTTTERLDQIEELAALIEARVLAELERRGGQHRGWI